MNKSILMLGLVLLSTGLIACGDGPGTGITSIAGAPGVYTGPTGEATITRDNLDDVLEAMRYSTLVLPFTVADMAIGVFDALNPSFPATPSAPLTAGGEVIPPAPTEMSPLLGVAVQAFVRDVRQAAAATTPQALTAVSPVTVGGSGDSDIIFSSNGGYAKYTMYERIRPDLGPTAFELYLQAEASNYMLQVSPTQFVYLNGKITVQLLGAYPESLIVPSSALTAQSAASSPLDMYYAFDSMTATVDGLSVTIAGVVDVLFAGQIKLTNTSTGAPIMTYALTAPVPGVTGIKMVSNVSFVDKIADKSFRDESTTEFAVAYDTYYDLLRTLPLAEGALTVASAEINPVMPKSITFTSMGRLWSSVLGGSVGYGIEIYLSETSQMTGAPQVMITGLGGSQIRVTIPGTAQVQPLALPALVEFDAAGDGTFEYSQNHVFFDGTNFYNWVMYQNQD